MIDAKAIVRNRNIAIEVNSVLRNTYMLLGLIILFCAFACTVAINLALPSFGFFVYLIGLVGIMFMIQKTRNSMWSLVWTFVLSAFLGAYMAPMIAYTLSVNPSIVLNAFTVTAVTFFGLSAYTVIRKHDFSWLGQFLTVGCLVVLGLIVLTIFLPGVMSGFSLLISGFLVFLCAAGILYRTSAIVLGGERNYVMAAVGIFVDLWVMFMSLINIFGIMGGDD